MRKYLIFCGIILAIALVGLTLNNNKKNSLVVSTQDSSTSSIISKSISSLSKTIQNTNMQPEITINKSKKYTAIMSTTEGDITIELYAAKTPITVNNFVTLSNKNFYNDVIFHRVIPGFMIQGGDPTGTGTGGPGYKFNDEPFTGEYTRGTLAMANAGPNTNGSQFFIMVKDTPLPKSYVIFGKVINGLEVVDKIVSAPTVVDNRENSKPINPVKIKNIVINEE